MLHSQQLLGTHAEHPLSLPRHGGPTNGAAICHEGPVARVPVDSAVSKAMVPARRPGPKARAAVEDGGGDILY